MTRAIRLTLTSTMMRPSIPVSILLVLLFAPHDARANGNWGERASYDPVGRPSFGAPAACSLTEAVCVHRAASTSTAAAAAVLLHAEHALMALRALSMPAPLEDGGLGGSYALDLYVDRALAGSAAYGDMPSVADRYDRASAYGLVGLAGSRDTTVRGADSCQLESDVTRTVAQASLLGLDAAINDGTLAMQSSYLASLIAPCSTLEAAAINRFQRTPWRGINEIPRESFAGSMLFPSFLDSTHGVAEPGKLMTALIAISAQKSPNAEEHFHNEPDIFDALRKVTKARDHEFADVLANFAIARAFAGDRSDGSHLIDTEHFGALARPRFEWAVDYDSFPRRLAPAHPVHPTGSSFLWVDFGNADTSAGLLVKVEWEESFVFMWSLVRVDQNGRELGRVTKGAMWGKNELVLSIADLKGAAGVLIVGVSLGNDDRSEPFDPDHGAPRAASYTVTLHART